MNSVFTYRGNGNAEGAQGFVKLIESEFYDGTMRIFPQPETEIVVNRATVSVVTLFRFYNNISVKFYRSIQNIRKSSSSFRVIWCVKSGSLKIVTSNVTLSATKGQCVIMNPSIPFFAHTFPESDDFFEVVGIVVPEDLFHCRLSEYSKFYQPFSIDNDSGGVILNLFNLLLESGPYFDETSGRMLVDILLNAIGDGVKKSRCMLGTQVQPTSSRRMKEILTTIERNISDVHLNSRDIARRCGVSIRYLHYIFRQHDTTFSSEIWNRRLELARTWLTSADLDNYPIHEIASLSGFKNSSHFARMFRAKYGEAPTIYRAQARQDGNRRYSRSKPSDQSQKATGATTVVADKRW